MANNEEAAQPLASSSEDPFQYRKITRIVAGKLVGCNIFGWILLLLIVVLYVALLSGLLPSPFPPEWDEDGEDTHLPPTTHHFPPELLNDSSVTSPPPPPEWSEDNTLPPAGFPPKWTDITGTVGSPTGICVFVGVVAFFGAWFAIDLSAESRLYRASKQNVDPRVALRQLQFWKVYWIIANGISFHLILGWSIAFPLIFPFPFIFDTPAAIVVYVAVVLLFLLWLVASCYSCYKVVGGYALELEMALEVGRVITQKYLPEEGDVHEV